MLRLLAYLIYLMILVSVLKQLGRVLGRLFESSRVEFRSAQVGATRAVPRPAVSGLTARDPVCGTFVSTELPHRLISATETLHFCSRECLERYQENLSNA
jgi:YHS domain-containing protein